MTNLYYDAETATKQENDRKFGLCLELCIEKGPRHLHDDAALRSPYFRGKLRSNVQHVFRYPNELQRKVASDYSQKQYGQNVSLNASFAQMNTLTCAVANKLYALCALDKHQISRPKWSAYLASLDDFDNLVFIHKHHAPLRNESNSMLGVTGMHDN